MQIEKHGCQAKPYRYEWFILDKIKQNNALMRWVNVWESASATVHAPFNPFPYRGSPLVYLYTVTMTTNVCPVCLVSSGSISKQTVKHKDEMGFFFPFWFACRLKITGVSLRFTATGEKKGVPGSMAGVWEPEEPRRDRNHHQSSADWLQSVHQGCHTARWILLNACARPQIHTITGTEPSKGFT